MTHTQTQYATRGLYVLLAASGAVIAFCRAVEWANYWLQQPSDRMKGGKLR